MSAVNLGDYCEANNHYPELHQLLLSLEDESKLSRKNALLGIRKEVFKERSVRELNEIYEFLEKPLVKAWSDASEKCRELSVALIADIISRLENPEKCLPYVIPTLTQRLSNREIVEPSEEVRYCLLCLLLDLLVRCGFHFTIYLDDVIKILQRTIIDPYPEVKIESCMCASKLAKAIPQCFHLQSESLIDALLKSLSHQHAKVRVNVIEAIGDVVQYGNNKSVDDVVSHLAQRLFDQSPQVRLAVTKLAGMWLIELPDRYSFFHKLQPLLLTSTMDDVPLVRESAVDLWLRTGKQFEQENESDLKDQQDFQKPKPEHYPPGVERPNLGCRELVYRNASKILPAIFGDLNDWIVATRVKAATLLYVMLLNLEERMTHHLERLLSGLYRACQDEEKEVVSWVLRSANLIGYFVPGRSWTHLLLPYLNDHSSPSVLQTLSKILDGSKETEVTPYLHSIIQVLASDSVCRSEQVSSQRHLLACLENIMEVSGENVVTQSQQLFTIITTIQALAAEEAIYVQGKKAMEKLSNLHGFQDTMSLYELHMANCIEFLKPSYHAWNHFSIEMLIFTNLVSESGPVAGHLLDTILPIFAVNLKPDKDPELILKLFLLLSRLLMKANETLNSQGVLGDYTTTMLTEMILPNCVWRAGRTSGAIRSIAVSCLWALLQSQIVPEKVMEEQQDSLLTHLLGLMEDDNKTTRLVSCKVTRQLLMLYGKSVEIDRLHKFYLELLKRLDDVSDEVRVMAAKTFVAYFAALEGRYDVDLYKAHLEFIYKGLLIHMDDSDSAIRLLIQEVLKRAGKLAPSLLIRAVEEVLHKHRSEEYCQELIEHLGKLT